MHPADLTHEGGWAESLRKFCLWIFALIPLALLFSRTTTEIMIAVIGLSFLAVVIARRRWMVFTTPVVAVLVVLWVYLFALSGPLAWSDIGRTSFRGFVWLRFLCLFAAATFWLFRDKRDFQKVAILWGVTLWFCIADGLVQGFFGISITGRPVFVGQRLTGPLDRPNIGRFTAFLLYPAFAAFLLARESWLDRRRAIVLAFSMVLIIFFVVFTAERGATLLSLATFISALLLLVMISRQARVAGLALIVVSLIIPFVTVWLSSRLQIRIAPTESIAGDFWNSEYGELMRATVTVWKVQPWTGVGLANFQKVCEVMEPELYWGCLRHPHNIYLEWLAEAGVFGLAGFLLFVGAIAALVLGTLRRRKACPLTVALVIACPILTLFPLVPSQSFFSNWAAMLWWSSISLTCAVAFHLRFRERG